jgi:hypothetical protein
VLGPWVMLLIMAFSKGPNRAGVTLLSSEDVNGPNFQNVVFSGYLEFRSMDKVKTSIDSKSYIPSSEPFRF